MKERPTIYRNVLVIGGQSSSVNGLPVARIGGIWSQPNLGLSYLLAARHVLEAGERENKVSEVALPTAYLQRHAFEVAVKDVAHTALVIRRDERWLAELTQDASARPGDIGGVPFIHSLSALVGVLRDALAQIGFGEVPAEIVAVAEQLGEAEQFEPTRFRYLNDRSGARSFPHETFLNVGEAQERLETLFENVFEYQDVEVEKENLVTALAHHGMGLDQAIMRIVPLDEL